LAAGKIIAYRALDEPLIKHFGSEKMIPLIKIVGTKEDEVIGIKWLPNPLSKARKKLFS
jgi:preprotein translocase subunit SecA